MRTLLILCITLLASGCSDQYYQEQYENSQRRIYELEQERRMLYFSCSNQYVPVCLENSIYQGCLLFKNSLNSQDVKLTADQWAFCDKYQEKK